MSKKKTWEAHRAGDAQSRDTTRAVSSYLAGQWTRSLGTSVKPQ